MQNNGKCLRVVSSQKLGNDSLFAGFREVRIKRAGAFSFLRRSETFLLPPDADVLLRGERLKFMPPQAQPLRSIWLQAVFRALVKENVQVRNLRWDEGDGVCGMRMELHGGPDVAGLLVKKMQAEKNFEGYIVMSKRLPDETVAVRIIGERGRRDLREAYRYLRTLAEPEMKTEKETA